MVQIDAAASAVNDNDTAPPPKEPEMKFNPWHDPDNGQFTFGPGGTVGAAAEASMAKRPEVPISINLNSGAVTYPDGHVEVLLDPPTPYRYFATRPDVAIDPAIEERVNTIAKNFKDETGKILVINSGTRSSSRQARAMYDKFQAGSTGSEYGNQVAASEVRASYLKGKEDKLAPKEIVSSMKSVIDRQIKNGTYLSYHISGRAVDIRTLGQGYSASEKAKLRASVERAGGVFLEESKPPHIHVQFPEPVKKNQ